MRGRDHLSIPRGKARAMPSRSEPGMVQPGDLRIGGQADLCPCPRTTKQEYEQGHASKDGPVRNALRDMVSIRETDSFIP
ncbi:hypothetical protein C6W92_15905 [Roseovarius sp. A46]|nr:hypothetical protein C6W92_15905 [Roseovarius sp. A46]